MDLNLENVKINFTKIQFKMPKVIFGTTLYLKEKKNDGTKRKIIRITEI